MPHESNVIKIFYPDYYPSVSLQCGTFPPLHVTKQCLYPGTMVEILHEITKQANLTIQPFIASDFGYQLNELDDIGPVVYDLIENGTIDLIAQPLQWTATRAERFSFTNFIYHVQNRVIHRMQDRRYEEFWSFFNIYDSFTWLAFLIAWILQLIFCLITQRCEARLSGRRAPNIGESAFQILRIQLLQPESSSTVQFRTIAGKFSLFFFSLVQCSILLGIFSSFILANIIKSSDLREKDSIQTIINGLKRREMYVSGTHTHKWIFEVFNTSTEYPFLEIHQAMLGNPIRLKSNINEVIDSVSNDYGIVFNQEDDRSFFQSMTRCNIVSIFDKMPQVKSYLMMRKGNPLEKRINNAIEANRILFTGIVTKYFQKTQAKSHCVSKRNVKPLKLIPYTGLLIVCLSILFTSFIVFLFEIFVQQ